ncbi:MAG: PP2C family protein-serine/threonine phosphatase [Actinomycetota bacterium]|nr:PP2C family protein-serine/threonine phosphatase [Actinomycetota bacterium]
MVIGAGSTSRFVDRPQVRERSALRVERLASWMAAAAGAIGATVLVGYLTRIAWVVKLSDRLPPMYPNAALGLICGAVAVIGARRSGAVRAVAAVAVLGLGSIGIVSLGLNITRSERTWFEGLFPDDFVAPTTVVGGRPVPETCLAFVLLAVALGTLVLRRGAVVGQAFGIAGAAVGLSAVFGYMIGVDRSNLGGHLVYVGMALHTGVAIALLGAAAACARPNVGVMAQLLDGGIAGGVSRRVTLMVAVAPALLLVAGVVLAHALPTEELSQSVFSVLQVAVLSAAVLIPTAVIGRTERQLRERLDAARRREEHRGDVDTLVEAVTAEMTITAPDLPGWEIGMRYQPATGHLAGDSVQVHTRDEPRPATLIAIVDVAGHDVFSAVVAYGLRAHIGALWENGADLATVVRSANAKLVRRHTIATAVLIVIEPDATSVEVVNAGHPAPVHLRARQQTEWTRTGPLLGLPGAAHGINVFDILPDDLIVFYTDGVTEARGPGGRQLGDEFIQRLITARQAEPAATIAGACVDAAIEHAQSRLSDDVLVIAARRLPNGAGG